MVCTTNGSGIMSVPRENDAQAAARTSALEVAGAAKSHVRGELSRTTRKGGKGKYRGAWYERLRSSTPASHLVKLEALGVEPPKTPTRPMPTPSTAPRTTPSASPCPGPI